MSQDYGSETGMLGAARRRTLAKPLLRGACLAALLLISACMTALRHLQLPEFLAWPISLPPRCSAEERGAAEGGDADSAHAEVTDSPRVALLFFGLPRSLPYTLPSIHENVLQPLRDAGYRPTVFVHTYNDSAADTRSNSASPEEWQALEPFSHRVTDQEDVLRQYGSDIDACLAHGTGWEKDGPLAMQVTNTRNWVCQLQSVREVSQLWQHHYEANHDSHYAAVAFMRPDVFYHDPFPTQVIPSLKEGEVYVPAWSDNGGINDRFALLHPGSALRWQHRLPFTLRHCLEIPIHSETFTEDFADYEGFEVRRQEGFTFFRVRGNGNVCRRDGRVPGYRDTLRAVRDRKRELQSMTCW